MSDKSAFERWIDNRLAAAVNPWFWARLWLLVGVLFEAAFTLMVLWWLSSHGIVINKELEMFFVIAFVVATVITLPCAFVTQRIYRLIACKLVEMNTAKLDDAYARGLLEGQKEGREQMARRLLDSLPNELECVLEQELPLVKQHEGQPEQAVIDALRNPKLVSIVARISRFWLDCRLTRVFTSEYRDETNYQDWTS